MGMFLVTIILCVTTVPCSSEGNVIYNNTKEYVDICCDNQSQSCENNCGKFKFAPCSCDIRCIIYGTCCDDFKTVCPDLYEAGSTEYSQYLNQRITCSTIGSYPVISSCPNGTTDSEEYRRCTSGDIDNFLDVMPVVDLDTWIYFKNIYCVRCHKTTGRNAIMPVSFNIKADTKMPLAFKELWQLMKKPESRLKSDMAYDRQGCVEQRENSYNACPCGTPKNPCPTLKEPVLNRTFKSYRIYGENYWVITKSKQVCDVPDLQFESPSYQGFVHVYLRLKKGKNISSLIFSSAGFPWLSIECNFDTSDCMQECRFTIPMLNDTCYNDFRFFILSLKVRVVKENLPEVINNATRKIIIDNIIKMKSAFNFSFPWRVLDKGEKAKLWNVRIYLGTIYRPPLLHSNELMVNSSFNTLISNLTRFLRHTSFNRTLVVCLAIYDFWMLYPTNECSGTLVQKELLQEVVSSANGSVLEDDAVSSTTGSVLEDDAVSSTTGSVLSVHKGTAVYVVPALAFLMNILK